MLSTVEVLVIMGSDPLNFCVGGKVIPAQRKAIQFLGTFYFKN